MDEAALVSAFKSVRDIPYKIPLNYEEEDNCCSGKSSKLFDILKINGYKVRYRVCVFLWDDIPLPEDVKKVPHDKDCTHTYVEIFLEGRWKVVDPTWDNGLKNIFHINEWDGKSDTEIAVIPIKIFTPLKSLSIVSDQTKEVIDDDLNRNREFYKALNEWLNRIRQL